MIRILVLERGRQSRRRKGDLWWRERGRSGLFLRVCSQGSPQGAGTPRGPKGGSLTEDLRPRWLACLSLFPFLFSLLLHGASGPTQISTARAASRQAREESRPSAWWTFSQGPCQTSQKRLGGRWTGELGEGRLPRSDDEGGAGAEPWSVPLQTHPTLQRAAEMERRQRRGSRASSPPPPAFRFGFLEQTSLPVGWALFRDVKPPPPSTPLHHLHHPPTTAPTQIALVPRLPL